MIRTLPVAAALALAACASAPPAPTVPAAPRTSVVALANAGFEADMAAGARCPPQWGCSAHADPGSYAFVMDPALRTEGRQSLRVEQVRSEPWALATQYRVAGELRGARVRFSVSLRLEGVTGNGAGPVFLAQTGSGVTLASKQDLAKGTADWRRATLEFVVPRGADGFEVGLLLEGPGKAWIDDARLEVLELPQSP